MVDDWIAVHGSENRGWWRRCDLHPPRIYNVCIYSHDLVRFLTLSQKFECDCSQFHPTCETPQAKKTKTSKSNAVERPQVGSCVVENHPAGENHFVCQTFPWQSLTCFAWLLVSQSPAQPTRRFKKSQQPHALRLS